MPHPNKWDAPSSLRTTVLLMCAAITVASIISIMAALFVGHQQDEKQDVDYAALCSTSKRIAAINAFRIEKDGIAFTRTADLMGGLASSTSDPTSSARLSAIGEAFRDAATSAEVAAEAHRAFASAECADLPPISDLTVPELERELNRELARRVIETRPVPPTNSP